MVHFADATCIIEVKPSLVMAIVGVKVVPSMVTVGIKHNQGYLA